MNRRHQCGPPRDEIQCLEDHVRRFHRGAASSGSDVDVLVAFDGPATNEPELFMTRPTATPPGPASATFHLIANPHRSVGYASGSLGRETPHLRDLGAPRYVRVMNSPG